MNTIASPPIAPLFQISQLSKYIKYINFIIIYIVTFTLVCIPKYELAGMGLLISFNFIIQSFLLYDIFSIGDAKNVAFIFIISFGIIITILSSLYILKLLLRVQSKQREVGNIKNIIDKNTNTKYHLFSNLFITNIGLIIVNAIIYFNYTFSSDSNYKDNYLYNNLNYENIDYSFFENIYYKTASICKDWYILFSPIVFLGVLFWNIIMAILINILKTLRGFYNHFFNTLLFLFKSASLILIPLLTILNFYFSISVERINIKNNRRSNGKKSNKKNLIPTNTNYNNTFISQITDVFNNLNMQYLMNYKVGI